MLLGTGVLLWALIHLFVAVAPDARKQIIGKIGIGPYKGLFSLALIGALVMIVMGWKAFPASQLYLPPAAFRHVTMLLMPIALIFFVASSIPSNIKQVIRHPQLIGVKTWALAHLLANGETRSVILFGGLLAWAVLEVILINRRDPEWVKPARTGPAAGFVVVFVGLAATAALMLGHPWFTGVAILPR